jgi:hypothetical protein
MIHDLEAIIARVAAVAEEVLSKVETRAETDWKVAVMLHKDCPAYRKAQAIVRAEEREA